MKITKLKTRYGEFGSPVSTDLETIIERMRSEDSKAATETIRRAALQLRLMMEQGMPRYQLEDTDRLPYLLFSATFGKGGLEHPNTFTRLLLLNIPCPKGMQSVNEMKQLVSQVPYTMLAFAGASGVTLKVVVRCSYNGGATPWVSGKGKSMSLDTFAYLTFLKDAQQSAAHLYTALVQCDLIVGDPSLTMGCRLAHDPKLYYNPQALELPVIHDEAGVLRPYSGTKADDDGTVVWYPDSDEQERYKLEFYTCMKKAVDECADNADHALALLATYCYKAGLEEEACITRTLWDRHFKPLGDDLIRKVFRTTYDEPYDGKTLSQMNEKERIIRSIENFFRRRYQFRYNVVKQLTEFRPNNLTFRQWQPLTDRQLKSIVVEQMKEGGESWMNDIRIYIESAHIKEYNPVHEFLAGCGDWDRKANYIEDFARRLPTDYELWPKYFHRWFLAMVAQAMNINRDYGNSMVPMLIGGEGIKKSVFCKNILPPSMREYYMDDIKMQNAEQVERVLGRMWLVCIDEFNAKTDREQAKVKRLLTEKDVQMRKMRSSEYTMTPRLCSFIATTNDPTPLSSAEGNRRYLCIEVKGEIDMTERINYKQMYAQAVAELNQPDCLYWFTSEDEQIIREHNQSYMEESTSEGVLPGIFEPTTEHTKRNLWRVVDIQQELSKHLSAKDVPSLKTLSVAVKALRWPRGANNGIRGYYLKLRKNDSQ